MPVFKMRFAQLPTLEQHQEVQIMFYYRSERLRNIIPDAVGYLQIERSVSQSSFCWRNCLNFARFTYSGCTEFAKQVVPTGIRGSDEGSVQEAGSEVPS